MKRDMYVGVLHNLTRICWRSFQDGNVMSVGDAVEMVPRMGEALPRVARIEALWSERPLDGCERFLARCRMYCRPPVGLSNGC